MMQYSKVKFGAKECTAQIPGGLVAMESQLCREARVQARAQAPYAISVQQPEG